MSDTTNERPATVLAGIKGPQNVVAGLFIIAVAMFAIWASSDLDFGSLRAMGPGLMPRSVAVLLGLLGLLLVVVGFTTDGEKLQRWSWRGPFFVIAAILAFAATVRVTGLIIAGPLVVIISGLADPDTRWKELIIFAIAMTAFCIGLFKYGLNLPMPIIIIPGILYI